MELAYFKIVETVQRHRHRTLRARLEEFARTAAKGKLSHKDIVHRIARLAPLLPEPFNILHMRKQFPSHDGHSPLGHTMNALIEAAYLAPALVKEFPELHVEDIFIALLYHDLGKIDGAQQDHEERSIEMAKHHLKMMDLLGDQSTPEDIKRGERILFIIENGEIISQASKLCEGGMDWKRAAALLSLEAKNLLPELFLFNYSDASSIPGRSGRTMEVISDYAGVIDVRPKLIEAFRKLLKRQG